MPPFDPVVYFRMMLVAYLYGIDSDRHLCEDVYCHLAYRWFCRLSLEDKVPEHSSFSRIRDRYREAVHGQVFHEIVMRCQQHGLVAEEYSVMWKIEGLFAEAKQNHGLSRARYRGRSKVQIQADLSATAQNLKRLVKAIISCLIIRLSNRRRRTPHRFRGLRTCQRNSYDYEVRL